MIGPLDFMGGGGMPRNGHPGGLEVGGGGNTHN